MIEEPCKCTQCQHLIEFHWACKAFPLGIPLEIRQGLHNHAKPYPGDGGILFTPKEEAQP